MRYHWKVIYRCLSCPSEVSFFTIKIVWSPKGSPSDKVFSEESKPFSGLWPLREARIFCTIRTQDIWLRVKKKTPTKTTGFGWFWGTCFLFPNQLFWLPRIFDPLPHLTKPSSSWAFLVTLLCKAAWVALRQGQGEPSQAKGNPGGPMLSSQFSRTTITSFWEPEPPLKMRLLLNSEIYRYN